MSDATCVHERFLADVNVHRIKQAEAGPVTNFTADVKIQCAACGLPFEFLGVGMGSSPVEPLTSPDRLELRAPIVPQGAQVNPNLIGFRVHTRGTLGGGVVQ